MTYTHGLNGDNKLDGTRKNVLKLHKGQFKFVTEIVHHILACDPVCHSYVLFGWSILSKTRTSMK